MARRGENIYKRKDGRWEGRYKNGTKDNGKTKYSSVYAKTYSDVKHILNKKKTENIEKIDSKLTVQKIFSLWFDSIKVTVKESTYMNYLIRYEKHIRPALANIRYEKLTVEKLNKFVTRKLSEGLSAKYVCDISAVIKSAFRFIHKKYGYVDKSEFMELPKVKKTTEKKMLNENEQSVLRKYLIENSSLTNLGILISLSTGLRIGELCALKWSDIDLDKKTIYVRHTLQRIKNTEGKSATKIIVTVPKSYKSIREIPIPDFILSILKKFQRESETYLLTGTLKPVEPRIMLSRFKKVLKKLELSNVSFHTLRHIFATNCIALGFDVKTLSEILGHGSVKVTLDLYVHSSMERKKECMKLLSKIFMPSKFQSAYL